MRTYYQVLFTHGNTSISKRFDSLTAASALCDRVGGAIRICRERIRVDWKEVIA